jgi:digeranylgeranylglycerophospholipid reductase
VKCDVLVVGASSAGLTAATAAAMGGASVILLDKDLDGFHHVANTLFEGMAAHSGIMVSDCYLEKELQGMRIISPGGAAVTIAAKGYFIDRQRFDEYYIRLAQSCGVALMSGKACSAKLDGNRRIVTLAEDQINARVVVDASGVDSTMARQVGMEPMHHPEDIAWAIEADVEHQFIGEEMFFQYWIGSMAPGWKATFSPAGGNHATLGVFVRGRGQNVLPFFHEFLKRFKAYKKAQYKDIEDLKILSVRRGGDPICVLPGQIVADSFLVTGGAAGQSGLAYSMRAGTIAGMAAADAVANGDVTRKALSKYEMQWNREFYWQYRMGRSSLQTIAMMKDEEIDQLVNALSGKTLIYNGSFLKKALFAGAKLALIRPKTLLDLTMNLARG